MILKISAHCLSLLAISSTVLAQPSVADPCLSSETLAHIQRRLGQVGAIAFVAGTGLGLCSNESSEFQQSLKQISDLNASADINPEQISCPSSSSAATQADGFYLVPNAAYPSGTTKTCSCSQYKEALKVAQDTLRRLAK